MQLSLFLVVGSRATLEMGGVRISTCSVAAFFPFEKVLVDSWICTILGMWLYLNTAKTMFKGEWALGSLWAKTQQNFTIFSLRFAFYF